MENIDQHLESALSFAQYQTTINQQRRLLKEKFESDTVIAVNGGLFKITQEWLGSFDTTNNWYIDTNGNPTHIENPGEFLAEARTIYRQAVAKYGEEFGKLRTQRSVKTITDL
jgi:hypothetical protein